MTSREPGTYFELDEAWGDPGWTRVPNSIARCSTVSRRVKGWILEVASHVPGRRLTFDEMLGNSTDGRDATYSTINEAIKAGFVTRRQERDQYGRMGAVVYRVHVTPQNPSSAPVPGKPVPADPIPEDPDTSKKTRSSSKKTRTSLEDLKPKSHFAKQSALAESEADTQSVSGQSLTSKPDQAKSRDPKIKTGPGRRPGKYRGQARRGDLPYFNPKIHDPLEYVERVVPGGLTAVHRTMAETRLAPDENGEGGAHPYAVVHQILAEEAAGTVFA